MLTTRFYTEIEHIFYVIAHRLICQYFQFVLSMSYFKR